MQPTTAQAAQQYQAYNVPSSVTPTVFLKNNHNHASNVPPQPPPCTATAQAIQQHLRLNSARTTPWVHQPSALPCILKTFNCTSQASIKTACYPAENSCSIIYKYVCLLTCSELPQRCSLQHHCCCVAVRLSIETPRPLRHVLSHTHES